MRYRDWQEELEAYFAGELSGGCGLSSWLGAWGERKSPQGVQTSGSPPEPGAAALEFARAVGRVEAALALLSRPQVVVLHGFYGPRGPGAWGIGLFRTAGLAGVALALPAPVLEVLTVERERRDDALTERCTQALADLRAAMRSGSPERARAELELLPLPVRRPADAMDELRALPALGREGRRILRRVETAAKRAHREALAAYEAAYAVRREEWHDARRARLRAAVVGK